MKLVISLIVVCATFMVSCSTGSKVAGNYTFQTECMGVEMDGSQTLRVGGSGRNRTDAIEQAKKNAIRDVLFKGIINGKPDCNMKPVVPEVNAQEKYEDYFNKFFADNGPYKEFISSKDGSDLHIEVIKNREKAGSQESYRIIVRVLRAELKQRMVTDGILK